MLRAGVNAGRIFSHSPCVCTRSAFKQFLELEPQVREVVQQFYNSKYATCLRTLEQMRVSTASVPSGVHIRRRVGAWHPLCVSLSSEFVGRGQNYSKNEGGSGVLLMI